MRRRRARLLAIATGVAVLALAATFAALRARPAAAPVGTAVDGLATYERLGCPACHALAGRGNPRLPLDGVGGRLSRDAIRTWIVTPRQMDPTVRKPVYDRVPKAEVDAVVDLLAASRRHPVAPDGRP
jgi:mono/diheme cytochrome c family protein